MIASMIIRAPMGSPTWLMSHSREERATRWPLVTALDIAPSKRCFEDARGFDFPSNEGNHRPALTEHINALAIGEFFQFGRVPDETAVICGLAADDLIDFLFSMHIDPAQWIIEEDYLRVGSQCAGEKYLLLVAAAQAEDRAIDGRRLDLQPVRPG